MMFDPRRYGTIVDGKKVPSEQPVPVAPAPTERTERTEVEPQPVPFMTFEYWAKYLGMTPHQLRRMLADER